MENLRSTNLDGAWELQLGRNGDELVIVTESGARICLGRAVDSVLGILQWVSGELATLPGVTTMERAALAVLARELASQSLHSVQDRDTKPCAVESTVTATRQ